MAKLCIIGAGAWGSALSIALSDNFETIYLHAHNQHKADILPSQHPELPNVYPDNVVGCFGFDKLQDAEAILIAVPSYGFLQVLTNIKPQLTNVHQIAWATKGFDTTARCFLHESFERLLPKRSACAISGPSFAFEVAAYKPTALVVAAKDKSTRNYWAKLLQTNTLRAYTNHDIIGVEVGGAVKNILAIAAGIAAGLGYGANTQAALITRGLAEMSRLGSALGAQEATFVGLSGLGDLALTCGDDLSRNRRFGKELANNHSVKCALDNVGGTVEGVNTLDLILSIAASREVEMPICEQVSQVVGGKITPTVAVNSLMNRTQTSE